jgi:hypothetical protein
MKPKEALATLKEMLATDDSGSEKIFLTVTEREAIEIVVEIMKRLEDNLPRGKHDPR